MQDGSYSQMSYYCIMYVMGSLCNNYRDIKVLLSEYLNAYKSDYGSNFTFNVEWYESQ
jgi:hypothetical protein